MFLSLLTMFYFSLHFICVFLYYMYLFTKQQHFQLQLLFFLFMYIQPHWINKTIFLGKFILIHSVLVDEMFLIFSLFAIAPVRERHIHMAFRGMCCYHIWLIRGDSACKWPWAWTSVVVLNMWDLSTIITSWCAFDCRLHVW